MLRHWQTAWLFLISVMSDDILPHILVWVSLSKLTGKTAGMADSIVKLFLNT